MARRLQLHEKLCDILGSKNVYFQPPASVFLKYPCLKYTLSGIDIRRADNGVYKRINRYEVIAIDPNPDSDIIDRMLGAFPMCSFDRSYAADKLNHFVFTLYY